MFLPVIATLSRGGLYSVAVNDGEPAVFDSAVEAACHVAEVVKPGEIGQYGFNLIVEALEWGCPTRLTLTDCSGPWVQPEYDTASVY